MRPTLVFTAAGLFLFFSIGVARFHSQRILQRQVAQAAQAENELPRRILWVWERPEDLHHLDPNSTGLAILEETLRLGSSVTPFERHQPVLIPPKARRIAVVRVETDHRFSAHADDVALLRSTVTDLVRVSSQPGIAALQIDFDAKRSERAFYRRLLAQLRQQMPPMLPLDITALFSWCSTDDWIGDLPINAAIPMYFRMEPDRRRQLVTSAPEVRLREPLCMRNVGVSTTQTVTFHRARLLLSAGRRSEAQTVLTDFSSRLDELPPAEREPSSVNALRGLEMLASPTEAGFLSFVPRNMLLASSEEYASFLDCREVRKNPNRHHDCVSSVDPEQLDTDASRILNQQAPLSVWLGSARLPTSLPSSGPLSPLRAGQELSSWKIGKKRLLFSHCFRKRCENKPR